jgi:hypothetical protein
MAKAQIDLMAVGGSSEFEIQEGTVVGSNAGTFTVTSRNGKTPYLVQLYNDTNKGTNSRSFIYWASSNPNEILWGFGASSGGMTALNAATSSTPNITQVSSTSVDFRLPTNSTYYTGDWKYTVVFK